MSIAEALAPIEARNKAAVMSDTWGHLFPKGGEVVTILWTYTAWGEIVIIDFDGIESSPWSAPTICEMLKKDCIEDEKIGVYLTVARCTVEEVPDHDYTEEDLAMMDPEDADGLRCRVVDQLVFHSISTKEALSVNLADEHRIAKSVHCSPQSMRVL